MAYPGFQPYGFGAGKKKIHSFNQSSIPSWIGFRGSLKLGEEQADEFCDLFPARSFQKKF